jgi:intergrase/recombinase
VGIATAIICSFAFRKKKTEKKEALSKLKSRMNEKLTPIVENFKMATDSVKINNGSFGGFIITRDFESTSEEIVVTRTKETNFQATIVTSKKNVKESTLSTNTTIIISPPKNFVAAASKARQYQVQLKSLIAFSQSRNLIKTKFPNRIENLTFFSASCHGDDHHLPRYAADGL